MVIIAILEIKIGYQHGLKINEAKTKYVKVGKGNNKDNDAYT